MENTSEHAMQEKIQQLLSGQLDAESRQELLEQARINPDLQQEIAFSKNLSTVLKHPELLQAHATLSAVLAEEGAPSPMPRSISWYKWLLYGLLAVGFFSGGIFWANTQGYWDSDAQKIAEETIRPLENVLYLPSAGRGLDGLKAGMLAYDNGRYAEAAQALEAYLQNQPDEDAARVYLGVSKLLISKRSGALAELSIAAQSEEPPIRDAANWYLALGYLLEDETGKAREILIKLQEGSLYENEAKILLQKLR